jgi:hypothetical protein
VAIFLCIFYAISKSHISIVNPSLYHNFLINIRIYFHSAATADLARNLIPYSAEQWGVLAVIRVAIRHLEEFTILDGTNSP